MKKSLAIVGLIVLAQSAHADATGGYIAVTQYQVAYLRLTQTGGSVDGALQTVTYDTSSSGYKTGGGNVLGNLHGSTLSLRGDAFLGQRSSLISGTYRTHTVTIDFPQDNGTFASMVFHSGSIAKWNSTVTTFETRMGRLAEWRTVAQDLQQTGVGYADLDAKLKNNALQLQACYAKVQPAQDNIDKAQTAVDKAQTASDAAKAQLKSAEQAENSASNDQQLYQTALDNYQTALNASSDADQALYNAQSNLSDAKSAADNIDREVGDLESTVKSQISESKVLHDRVVNDVSRLKAVESLLRIHSPIWKVKIPAWENPLIKDLKGT